MSSFSSRGPGELADGAGRAKGKNRFMHVTSDVLRIFAAGYLPSYRMDVFRPEQNEEAAAELFSITDQSHNSIS